MKWQLVMPVIAALLIAGLVWFAWLHGADLAVLNPKGPVGFEERNVIIFTVLLSAIVVVPLFVLLFFFAWKYRASNLQAQIFHDPNWDHDNWVAEVIWWCVPALIIICLSIVLIKTAHDLDPYRPLASATPAMTIEVVALDWKWLFIYPYEGIATVNYVEFPENVPVRFQLTADDAPMNQFWIPNLGGQIMVMQGMSTQINLMANQTGTFKGLSSEISGKGFAGMDFTAHAVSPADFAAWVSSVQKMHQPLDDAAYAQLLLPSAYNPAAYYSSVSATLYNDIIMKYMMPPMIGMQGMMPGMNMTP